MDRSNKSLTGLSKPKIRARLTSERTNPERALLANRTTYLRGVPVLQSALAMFAWLPFVVLVLSIGILAGCNKMDPEVKVHINELDDDEAGDRLDAAKELENMGKRAASAVPELAKCLKDEDRKVRYRAAKTLAKLGLASKSASSQLAEALANDDYVKVRYYSAKALDEIADHEPAQVKETLPNLVKALGDEDAKTRRYVLKTMAKLGAEAHGFLNRIEPLLDDSDKDVRRTAESTIRRIKKSFSESSQG